MTSKSLKEYVRGYAHEAKVGQPPALDLRTVQGRRYRSVLAELLEDAGPDLSKLSAMKRQLYYRCAAVICLVEQEEVRALNGEDFNPAYLVLLTGIFVKIARQVGPEKNSPVPQSLDDFLKDLKARGGSHGDVAVIEGEEDPLGAGVADAVDNHEAEGID